MKNKEKIKLLANIEPKKTMIVIEEKMESALEKLPQELLQKIYQCEAILEIVKGKKMVAHISKKPYTMPWFRITKQTWESLQTEINQNKENTDAIFELESVYLSNYITQNVVGYIEGTAVKDSFLVLTAHYDHLGRMGKNSYFPGANDNASGTSMVLSLADYFAKNPPKYSVAFILFSGEEVGLLGSEYFVKNPIIPLEKIKFLFNLDIVGTGDDGGTVVNSTIFKEDFERLNKINTEKKHLPKLATRGKAANSDHHYFTENGVKAFYIYTMGGIAYYHDVNDIADTLPLTKYQGVFRLLKDFFESF
ncbi:MAG: M28 family peptidase [Bacteroidetes bacterium]|nr:MAG: M28 family peptidase [Bacteroidota bacterium]TAG90341.1 MAG: M28 family peptidase [Bacteroidota bacterium]